MYSGSGCSATDCTERVCDSMISSRLRENDRSRAHAVELAPHRRQVLAPGVPEGVLDEQRVERVADADRVGDRCGVLVQGQHRVAEPDHGDWRLANRPPPGPGRTVTTPGDWTRRSASLNVPTET